MIGRMLVIGGQSSPITVYWIVARLDEAITWQLILLDQLGEPRILGKELRLIVQ